MARRVLAWAAMCDGLERVAMQINNTETTPSRSDIMVPSPLKRIKWRMDCTAIPSSHHRPITRLCISCKTFNRSRSRPFNVTTCFAIRHLWKWKQSLPSVTVPLSSVLVSFGMGSLSKRRSFPRKRESSPSTGHFRRFAEWIPAFAGMTAACDLHVLQVTPVSCLRFRRPPRAGGVGVA